MLRAKCPVGVFELAHAPLTSRTRGHSNVSVLRRNEKTRGGESADGLAGERDASFTLAVEGAWTLEGIL